MRQSAPSQVTLVCHSSLIDHPFGSILASILPPCSGQGPRPRGWTKHSHQSASEKSEITVWYCLLSVFRMPSGQHLEIILDACLLNVAPFSARAFGTIFAQILQPVITNMLILQTTRLQT